MRRPRATLHGLTTAILVVAVAWLSLREVRASSRYEGVLERLSRILYVLEHGGQK